MSLKNPRSINDSESNRITVVMGPSYLHTVNASRIYRKFDLDTMEQIGTDITVFGSAVNPIDITLVNTASAYIASSSARTAVLDLTTGYTADITTNAAATSSTLKAQQISYNSSANLAIQTRGSNGLITRVNPNSTITSITLTSPASAQGGGQIITLIAKGASSGNGYENSWICGTNNGLILELSSGMLITKTITLPVSPTIGSTSTQSITGLSYYYPNLAVTTVSGLLYIYDYPTSTITYTNLICTGSSGSGSINGVTLCESSSGETVLGVGRGLLTNNLQQRQSLAVLDFTTSNPLFSNYVQSSSVRTMSTGIKENRAFQSQDTSDTTTYKLRLFDRDPPTRVTQSTQIRDPQTDISANILPGRIIRIRDDGVGQTCIELDTNISAATTSLACRKNSNYIELAISQDTLTWDVREFSK